jgi:hypothetical protein
VTADILTIPLDRPDKLFSGNTEADHKLYNRLRLSWHPDRNGGSSEATAVFQQVNALWEARNLQLENGTWRGAGATSLKLPGDHALAIRYLRQRPFELGRVYVCRENIVYTSDGTDTSKALFGQAVRTVSGLRYADDRMRTEFARYLPVVKSYVPDTATGPAVIVEKSTELVALSDLLEHSGGVLDPRHVAWILSCLHNLSCYLEWAGIVHNAIDLDTYFVSPEYHSGALLGGWWYACQRKQPLKHLPARSAALWYTLPSSITKLKQARHRLDRESIRRIGRELLGDSGGTKLLHDSAVPAALAQWVTLPSGKSALEDYKQWERVREQSFGVRKFTKLDATAAAVYGA